MTDTTFPAQFAQPMAPGSVCIVYFGGGEVVFATYKSHDFGTVTFGNVAYPNISQGKQKNEIVAQFMPFGMPFSPMRAERKFSLSTIVQVDACVAADIAEAYRSQFSAIKKAPAGIMSALPPVKRA